MYINLTYETNSVIFHRWTKHLLIYNQMNCNMYNKLN